MPKRTSITGSELFIVDNSEENWKVLRYLHDWCQISNEDLWGLPLKGTCQEKKVFL